MIGQMMSHDRAINSIIDPTIPKIKKKRYKPHLSEIDYSTVCETTLF